MREAARELFSSPVFLSSVALSVFVYFSAWLLPEPLFSKAFVATLTLRLALAVGVLELNQYDISDRSGGPWTPLFERMFAKAGMSLDAMENLVYLVGHKGPHPAEYHSEVYQRLEEELGDCRTVAQCRGRLVQALKRLADDVCTPGSVLHQWVTKT